MTPPEPSTPTDLDAIEADIVRHRAELATTVDELARRADVPSRARARLRGTRAQVSARAEQLVRGVRAGDPRAVAMVAAPAAATVAAVLLMWRRGRR